MLGIFVVLPETDLSMQEYNNTHPSTFHNCTVTQADPYHRTSRKGAGSYKVLIDTSDCGDYELDRGVTKSNYRDVAQKLTPGEYRLELAATAVALEGVPQILQGPRTHRVALEGPRTGRALSAAASVPSAERNNGASGTYFRPAGVTVVTTVTSMVRHALLLIC